MTNLENKITRKTRCAYRILYQQPRQIVASFCPGDIIEFREHGRRQRYSLPIDAAFRLAVRLHAEQQRREKKENRKRNRTTNKGE